MSKKLEDLWMQVAMPDGTHWAVPVMAIAKDRAKSYADEFGNDVDRSLAEDTRPLFEEDSFEITDWAANNMNWSDVKDQAYQIEVDAKKVDYQEGWMNGEKEVILQPNRKSQ